jgi:hypothetical protein
MWFDAALPQQTSCFARVVCAEPNRLIDRLLDRSMRLEGEGYKI